MRATEHSNQEVSGAWLRRQSIWKSGPGTYTGQNSKSVRTVGNLSKNRPIPYTSAAAQMVTAPECTYGLDVIAQIGWWGDREHLNRKQIHARLVAQGVQICERQVDHLYQLRLERAWI